MFTLLLSFTFHSDISRNKPTIFVFVALQTNLSSLTNENHLTVFKFQAFIYKQTKKYNSCIWKNKYGLFLNSKYSENTRQGFNIREPIRSLGEKRQQPLSWQNLVWVGLAWVSLWWLDRNDRLSEHHTVINKQQCKKQVFVRVSMTFHKMSFTPRRETLTSNKLQRSRWWRG